MMYVFSFVVDGFAHQRVKITAEGWSVEKLEEALSARKIRTTIKEGGAVLVEEDGAWTQIGVVEAVDDESLEFGDFTVDRAS